MLVMVLGYGAAALLVILSMAAFVYAAATAMTAAYGPVVSALVIAVAALSLALIVIVVMSVRRARLRRQVRMSQRANPGVTELAAAVLPEMVRASPIGTLVAVAAAAYVLQRTTQNRR